MSATVATIGAGRGDRVDGAPHASDDVNTSEARNKVVANHSQLTQLAAQANSAVTLPANAVVTSVVVDRLVAGAAAVTLGVGFAGGAELAAAVPLDATGLIGGVPTIAAPVKGPAADTVVTVTPSADAVASRFHVYIEYFIGQTEVA